MNKNSLGYTLLKVGFIFLFVWFGSVQIANPSSWTALIPSDVISMTGQSAHNLVVLNGALEIIGALLLALNIFVPLVALLFSLHIVSIVFVIGLTPIGARDIALAVSALALALLSRKNGQLQ